MKNFDLWVLYSSWKMFPCIPSLLVLVFPQSCCHRLRLSGCCCEVCWRGGWSARDTFLCCGLSTPSEGGRHLTTTMLQQPHQAVAFVFCLVLVVLQKDISNSNLQYSFLHLHLRAILRPTRCLQKNVCVWLCTHNESRNSTYDDVFSTCNARP